MLETFELRKILIHIAKAKIVNVLSQASRPINKLV